MATGRVSTLFICLVAAVLCNVVQGGLSRSLLGKELKPTSITHFNRMSRSRGRLPLIDKTLATMSSDERRQILKDLHNALALSNLKPPAGTSAPISTRSLARSLPWRATDKGFKKHKIPNIRDTESDIQIMALPSDGGTPKRFPWHARRPAPCIGSKKCSKMGDSDGDDEEESKCFFGFITNLIPSWLNPFNIFSG